MSFPKEPLIRFHYTTGNIEADLDEWGKVNLTLTGKNGPQ